MQVTLLKALEIQRCSPQPGGKRDETASGRKAIDQGRRNRLQHPVDRDLQQAAAAGLGLPLL